MKPNWIHAPQFGRKIRPDLTPEVLREMLYAFRNVNPNVMERFNGIGAYYFPDKYCSEVQKFLENSAEVARAEALAPRNNKKFAAINSRIHFTIENETVELSKQESSQVIQQLDKALRSANERLADMEKDLRRARLALIVISKSTSVKVTKKEVIEKLALTCEKLELKPRFRVSKKGIIGFLGASI